MARQRQIVMTLLDKYGRTFAEEAGIRVADRPAPLYQLLVLSTLLSARISAEIAMAAARELFAAGYTTPKAMLEASWQDRVDALGRGGYRRYDERTATMLGRGAKLLEERWGGDLRRLRAEAKDDLQRMVPLLREFPGIGPAGAAIFLREVQAAWPQAVPFLDDRALQGADALGLPQDPKKLADLIKRDEELPRLAAALLRVSRGRKKADEIKEAAAKAG